MKGCHRMPSLPVPGSNHSSKGENKQDAETCRLLLMPAVEAQGAPTDDVICRYHEANSWEALKVLQESLDLAGACRMCNGLYNELGWQAKEEMAEKQLLKILGRIIILITATRPNHDRAYFFHRNSKIAT